MDSFGTFTPENPHKFGDIHHGALVIACALLCFGPEISGKNMCLDRVTLESMRIECEVEEGWGAEETWGYYTWGEPVVSRTHTRLSSSPRSLTCIDTLKTLMSIR